MQPAESIQDNKQQIYNRYAQQYYRRTSGFRRFLKVDYQVFLEQLRTKTILDAGSGPGRDSRVFKKQGYKPLCFDQSAEMLKICQLGGLPTVQGDVEQLASIVKQKFAGIWSYTSLTTMPKQNVWPVIETFSQLLEPGGVLFLGLIEGAFDGWKPADSKYAFPRYISRYQPDEVVRKLEKSFELLYFRRLGIEETKRNTYLNFLFRLNP